MIWFYKFCIHRMGFMMGHTVFLGAYAYIAGVVLLYFSGGADYLTINPQVVVTYTWSHVQAFLSSGMNKEQSNHFLIAMAAPLLFGLTLSLCFAILFYPFKQWKKRRDAKKPKPMTAEERLENIEKKLDHLTEQKREMQEKLAQKEASEKASAREATPSEPPIKQPNSNDQEEEVIIMPPLEKMEAATPSNTASDSGHPPSVDADFLKKK